MRTLAIGDIHGCCRALKTMAEFVGFTAEDTIVALGDYVDRGPDTKGVIEFLLELEQSGNLIALRGNHEVMMLESRGDVGLRAAWIGYGGDKVFESYGVELLNDIPAEHWDFIERTRRGLETRSHLFVHANIHPERVLKEQTDDMLFWERFGDQHPHLSGKKMVCGHTSQHSGLPVNLGHSICIDTWVYGDGWLTCLDVKSGTYWQTNEKGEKRQDDIAKLLRFSG